MTDNGPVPPGEYTVEAIKYEEKTSKAGNVFLAFEFKILGPSHANMRCVGELCHHWQFKCRQGSA